MVVFISTLKAGIAIQLAYHLLDKGATTTRHTTVIAMTDLPGPLVMRENNIPLVSYTTRCSSCWPHQTVTFVGI